MRGRTVACVAVLLLALTGCLDGPGEGVASPEPSVTVTEAETEAATTSGHGRKRRLSGPSASCGEVRTLGDGALAAVGVEKGQVDCEEALTVFRTYYREDTPKEGSAGVATVDGWECVSNSAAEAVSGRLSSCQKGDVRIVADVIP